MSTTMQLNMSRPVSGYRLQTSSESQLPFCCCRQESSSTFLAPRRLRLIIDPSQLTPSPVGCLNPLTSVGLTLAMAIFRFFYSLKLYFFFILQKYFDFKECGEVKVRPLTLCLVFHFAIQGLPHRNLNSVILQIA